MPSSCPFCKIAASYPPIPPSTYLQTTPDSDSESKSPADSSTPKPNEDGHAFLILSTKHVLAFLDIMPLTQGHVLVVPRTHYEKLSEVGVRISRELGTWLPIVSRAVMRTVFGESVGADTDPNGNGHGFTDPSWNWNVVQNNGVGAAQVVPHVHFHIVPRPPLGAASTSAKMSFVMFGRGQREDLDDEEAEKLVRVLRGEVAREVARVREVEGIALEGEVRDVEGGDGEVGVVGGKGRL
ncbi:HIT-like domain-containing protein [Aspergillus aurantiobrunneus]